MRVGKFNHIGGSGSVEDSWGALYAHLINCFGWTWEYIDDHMTFDRLKHLNDYWRLNPPVHKLIASYMGYEAPKTQAEKDKEAQENLAALFNALGGNDGK